MCTHLYTVAPYRRPTGMPEIKFAALTAVTVITVVQNLTPCNPFIWEVGESRLHRNVGNGATRHLILSLIPSSGR
jgi:hypothetical protein